MQVSYVQLPVAVTCHSVYFVMPSLDHHVRSWRVTFWVSYFGLSLRLACKSFKMATSLLRLLLVYGPMTLIVKVIPEYESVHRIGKITSWELQFHDTYHFYETKAAWQIIHFFWVVYSKLKINWKGKFSFQQSLRTIVLLGWRAMEGTGRTLADSHFIICGLCSVLSQFGLSQQRLFKCGLYRNPSPTSYYFKC